jgi:hypothetical protein
MSDASANDPAEPGDGVRAGAIAVSSLLPLFGSLCIHLTTLLALVCWMIPPPESAPSGEPERPVNIVLAKATGDEKVDYLDDAPESSSSAAASASQPGQATQTASALPSEDASVEIPANFALPSTTGLALPGESFLPGMEGGTSSNRRLPSGIDEAAILAADARGRGGEGDTTGTPAGLTVFGAKARGRTFAMVIDRSASMGDQGLGAIRAAADELAKQLEALNDQQRVQVIAYHAAPSLLNESWLPATEPNKEKLLKYLRTLPAFGSTNHSAALVAALKLKPRPEVIFLLTDGDDPGMDPGQLRIVRELAGSKTIIHAIHFGRSHSLADENHFMRKVSGNSGGSYVFVNVDKLP